MADKNNKTAARVIENELRDFTGQPNTPETRQAIIERMYGMAAGTSLNSTHIPDEAAQAIRRQAFNAGYVLACCNIVNLHDEPVIAYDTLSELGVSRDEITAMNLSEYDLDALNKIECTRTESPYSTMSRALSAKPAQGELSGITISSIQAAHIERQKEWCPDQQPDLSFRGNEMAGEVGEACNVIKKLERERQGWRGSRSSKEELASELADVIHTAILCAVTAGIDLEAATVEKFNATSDKNNLRTRIHAAPTTEAGK